MTEVTHERHLNVVRFRVKAGMEPAFLDAHRDGKAAWPGLTCGNIIKTGERTYVLDRGMAGYDVAR